MTNDTIEEPRIVITTETEIAKKIIADSGKTTFAYICLYNSLSLGKGTSSGIESLMVIYSNLMALHG
jgi:hypothetical protein